MNFQGCGCKFLAPSLNTSKKKNKNYQVGGCNSTTIKFQTTSCKFAATWSQLASSWYKEITSRPVGTISWFEASKKSQLKMIRSKSTLLVWATLEIPTINASLPQQATSQEEVWLILLIADSKETQLNILTSQLTRQGSATLGVATPNASLKWA